jgi:hypothetical protein
LKRRKKYTVLVLVKHSEAHFSQSPSEEMKTQGEINAFINSWSPEIIQTGGYHCCGLSDYDWFGTFETDEISYWEAFREDYHRRFHGRGIRRTEIIGVNHEEFVRATDRIEHYRTMRAQGVFPGMAETGESDG